jgi:mycothiol synthase
MTTRTRLPAGPVAGAGSPAAVRLPAAATRGRPALHTPEADAAASSAASAPSATSGQHGVSVHGQISESEAAAVLELVCAATETDGVGPLSEHVMLHLRYGGEPGARNLLLHSGGELAGYAHLDPTDEGPSGELVIHPAHRGRGLGLELTSALVAAAGQPALRLWAHGDRPAATRLATAAGFDRVRALWQMRRSLQTSIGRPKVADGITIRTFVVGRDEDPWLAVNRLAFARHPEQGGWTRQDLDLREREPWFDPDGFFLAERGGQIVGFHWTKIHGRAAETAGHGISGSADPGAGPPGPGHQPIGEVYVVGVDPAERGSGLGRALTVIGLRYLRSAGLSQVMLYVDEANTAAIRLYESLGFTHWDTDVMFASRPNSAAG